MSCIALSILRGGRTRRRRCTSSRHDAIRRGAGGGRCVCFGARLWTIGAIARRPRLERHPPIGAGSPLPDCRPVGPSPGRRRDPSNELDHRDLIKPCDVRKRVVAEVPKALLSDLGVVGIPDPPVVVEAFQAPIPGVQQRSLSHSKCQQGLRRKGVVPPVHKSPSQHKAQSTK